MNKTQRRNVEAWIRALRSGQYTQGKWVLKDPNANSYCCLGVLCELQGIPSRHGEFFASVSIPFDMFEEMTGLPFIIWGGDTTAPSGTSEMLVYANDTAGLNFDEIADLLDIMLLEVA